MGIPQPIETHKKQILYEQQLAALMEFHPLMTNIVVALEYLAQEKWIIQELFEGSKKKVIPQRILGDKFPFSRYETFSNAGKIPFVMTILKKVSGLREEEVDRKFHILNSVTDILREHFESLADQLSGGGHFPITVGFTASTETMTLGKILDDMQTLHASLKDTVERELGEN